MSLSVISSSQSNQIDNYQENLKAGVKYTAAAVLGTSLLASFYYFNLCNWEDHSFPRCGTPRQSVLINIGMPCLVAEWSYKAAIAFKNVFHNESTSSSKSA